MRRETELDPQVGTADQTQGHSWGHPSPAYFFISTALDGGQASHAPCRGQGCEEDSLPKVVIEQSSRGMGILSTTCPK